MRLAVGALACLIVGQISLALADPPADSAATQTSPAPAAATSAAAAATPAPAAAATPAAAASAPAPAAAHAAASAPPAASGHASVEISAPEMDRLEKHFLAEGYKIEMHNGEKYFCRREEALGSRLGGQKQCTNAQQLMFIEKDSQRQAEHAQHNQASSPGGQTSMGH